MSGSGLRPARQAPPGQPGPPRAQGRDHQPSPGAGLVDPPPPGQHRPGHRPHRFDVLDVDGPAGAQAIRALAAAHGLHSSGPLVRTGGGGWHYYLAPTGLGNVHPRGLEHVDWRGRGGYVVAPPSRHASGHPYQWARWPRPRYPAAEVPAPLLSGCSADQPNGRWSGPAPGRRRRPGRPLCPGGPGRGARPGRHRSGRPAQPAAMGVDPQPLQPGRHRRPRPPRGPPGAPPGRRTLRAARLTSPARPTAPWPPAARSAWPTPAAHAKPTSPEPTHASPPRRATAGERTKEGR